MSAVLQFQSKQVKIICPNCGMLFSVPENWRQARIKDRESFYCPNGHRQSYYEDEADSLRKQLQQKEFELNRAKNDADYQRQQKEYAERETERTRRNLKKTTTTLTNLKKRTANGICPCCHRTVKQLAEHITTEHPEYKIATGTDKVLIAKDRARIIKSHRK